jgi:hypothetical protein
VSDLSFEQHTTSESKARLSANRLFCLDLLKAIGIAAVVYYHSIFVVRSTYESSLLAVNILAAPLRFCVPVLFTISFLLLERGIANRSNQPVWSTIKKRLLRLAIPTAFWFGLTISLKLLKGAVSIAEPLNLLVYLVKGNAFQGAYYLLVLFQFLLVFAWLRNWFKHDKFVVLAILLQGIVFALDDQVLFNESGLHRSLDLLRGLGSPFFIYWFVYAALGVYLHRHWSKWVQLSQQLAFQIKLGLIVLIGLLFMVEEYWLYTLAEGNINPFEYNLFSCVGGTIVAFLCAASVEADQLPKKLRAIVELLSRYSLGIFCINGIVSELFLSLSSHSHLLSSLTLNLLEVSLLRIIGWIVLLVVSLQLSILLDRVGLGAVVR